MRRIVLTGLLFFSLAGCMVGPNYQRPDVDTPASWRWAEKDLKDTVNTAWWEQFQDPVLNELIAAALQENRDVKIAAARVEEYLGRYGTTRAAQFPQIGAGAGVGQERFSEKGAAPISPGLDNPATTYQLAVNGSWEIDLWGKLRRATESARAQLLATEENRKGVVLTLVSSVANGYVNLRDLDKRLEVALATARSRQESYEVFKLRFEGGVVSDIEINQAKALYEQALSTIPYFQKIITFQENAISLLLGRNPGPIPRGKTIDQLVLPAVPAGLPSDLLANRPDILQAEQELIAANANIGVAKALYFPAISLTGLFGFASKDLSDLFTGPANTWSWAVPITMPIFTAGAIAGQVQAAEAIQQQALLRYQKTIQTSFREVEDALVDQNRTREQLQAQAREVEATRNYTETARLRYDNGYTSYLEVTFAEQNLFSAQLAFTQTQGGLFQALVNLYKAMGGGWVVEADKRTAEAVAGEKR
jgi:multidrug efflux system outer membrane protein